MLVLITLHSYFIVVINKIFINKVTLLHFMTQPQTVVTPDQKSGNMETILSRVHHHVESNSELFSILQETIDGGLADPKILRGLGASLRKIPIRLNTETEDLTTLATHLARIKELAIQKGYADVLELLEQLLPYDRGYGL